MNRISQWRKSFGELAKIEIDSVNTPVHVLEVMIRCNPGEETRPKILFKNFYICSQQQRKQDSHLAYIVVAGQ